jgi:colicin import membrane protein
MAGFAREHALSLTLSILLHALVVGLLAYGFVTLRSRPTPQPAAAPAIDATVVDERRIEQEAQRLENEEKERQRQAEEERQQAEQAKREREEEQQKLEELKQQREAEEKAAQEREQQEQEAKRKADEARKQQQAKAAADKKRKELEARQRKESEAELKRRMAEEERRNAAESSGALAQYVAQIQARVQRAWIRPPSAREGLTCIVNVTQVPGGEVVGVKVGECNGDDAVRLSIEQAVYRASPLPEPPDPSLFERNLRLEFKPGD